MCYDSGDSDGRSQHSGCQMALRVLQRYHLNPAPALHADHGDPGIFVPPCDINAARLDLRVGGNSWSIWQCEGVSNVQRKVSAYKPRSAQACLGVQRSSSTYTHVVAAATGSCGVLTLGLYTGERPIAATFWPFLRVAVLKSERFQRRFSSRNVDVPPGG